MDTLLHVVCHNPDCPHADRVRTVRLPHLGDGVYAQPVLVCECSPTTPMAMATTTPEGWIFDEMALTPDWAKAISLVPAVPEPTEPPC